MITSPKLFVKRIPVPPSIDAIQPLRWTQRFDDRTLLLELEWNDFGLFYNMLFYTIDGTLLLSRPLIYGRDILKNYQHIDELRGLHIVPVDPKLEYFQYGMLPARLGTDMHLYYYHG